MSDANNPYAQNPYSAPTFTIASDAGEAERASFITKTYAHLIGAVLLFVLLEAILLSLPITATFVQTVFSVRYGMLMLLGAFMLVSWVAESWARSATSLSTQYLGLGVYIVAEAIFFVPLLFMATRIGDPYILPMAGIATVGLFGVLTAVVFVTRANFSFLRSVLLFGGMAAFGLIVCSLIFQFPLGTIFTVAMIGFACAYILYSTSNVLHEYRIGQHVAASLALFASVALLFWYILRLFMSRD